MKQLINSVKTFRGIKYYPLKQLQKKYDIQEDVEYITLDVKLSSGRKISVKYIEKELADSLIES